MGSVGRIAIAEMQNPIGVVCSHRSDPANEIALSSDARWCRGDAS